MRKQLNIEKTKSFIFLICLLVDGNYDVTIVGGGISGASLLYVLSRYTDIQSILLLEKYDDFATLNSNSRNNAQTLHFGDIETNYTLEKAAQTKKAAEMVLRYTNTLSEDIRDRIIRKVPKMVLGVGNEEISILDHLFNSRVQELFPTLRKIDADKIGKVEPNIVKGRDPHEKIEALLSQNGYMVDFGALTKSFLENSINSKGKKIDVLLNAEVEKVKESDEGYELFTKRGTFRTSFVSFDAGSYSLYFAKSLGYAKNLILLLIGGSFYHSRKVLNGKVYRVQKGHIPFSATHGDVDILTPDKTRFGPTVSVSALLEKGHPETFINTIQTEDLDFDTVASLATILGDKDMRNILERNAFYHVPYFGKHAFLDHEVRKIVPSLGYNDLEEAKGIGGIRPQIIDKKKRELEFGESIIRGRNIIFNITPSPGATVCLQNALKDALYIVESLGKKFDREKFSMEIMSL